MARLTRLILLIVVLAVGAFLLVCAAAISLVVVKRDALMRRGLQIAAARTGAEISARSLDLGVATSGLEAIVHDVSIVYHGQSAHVRRVEVIIGYGQLVEMRLLPMKSLRLAEPEASIVPPHAASKPQSQSFDLGSYVTELPKLASAVARLSGHTTIMNGKVALSGFAEAAQGAPRINLNASMDADSKVLSVAIERISWNGPPIDGFSASANFTIPTLKGQRKGVANGSIEFIRRSHIALKGQLQLAVSRSAALGGQLQVHAIQLPTLGQLGFDGSYLLSNEQFELAGAVLMSPALGLSSRVAAQVTIADQFSSNPKLNLTLGTFQARMDEVSKALGIVQTAALQGGVEVQRVQFATTLAPWREAFGQCSDAACVERQLVRALFAASSGALSIAHADLSLASAPAAVANLQQWGFLNLRLESPASFTLDKGAIGAENLALRIGPLGITHGQFKVDALRTPNGNGLRANLRGGFFGVIDLSQPALRSALPVSAQEVLRSQGRASAQINFGGALVDDNGRFATENPWLEFGNGFVQFTDHGTNTLAFSARAELERELLVSSVRVTVLGGGTLAANSRFMLPSHALRAQIGARKVDIWRWYRTLVQDSSLARFKVSGQLGGQLKAAWNGSSNDAPRLNGTLTAGGVSIDSAYTRKPVLVRNTRVVFNQHNIHMWANRIMLGGGDFNLEAAVLDFVNPAVKLTVSGSRLDLDAIDLLRTKSEASKVSAQVSTGTSVARAAQSQGDAGADASERSEANSSSGSGVSGGAAYPGSMSYSARLLYPQALSGSAHLAAVYVRGMEFDDVTAQFHGRGNHWDVGNFSAQSFHGSIKVAAVWNGDLRQFYLTGNAYKINARALFVALESGKNPPISGELTAKINAGASLAESGHSPPVLSCGGAIIFLEHGELGKADALVKLMELLNIKSWVTFHPPDLDRTGLPFDHIFARLTFAPQAITVQHLDESGPVIRLTGRGQISQPDGKLDLHLAVIPFTSPRWAFLKLPVVGSRLAHTFDQIASVRLKVTGPVTTPDVSPEYFGSAIDALAAIVELPLDIVPEDVLRNTLLPSAAQNVKAFAKCEPPS